MNVEALLVIISILTLVGAQADLHIDRPLGVAQCEETEVTFSGKHTPFHIKVLSSDSVYGTEPNALEDLGQTNKTSIQWTPRLLVGTSCSLGITDSIGNTTFSSFFTILPGTNTCELATSKAAEATSATLVYPLAFYTPGPTSSLELPPEATPTTTPHSENLGSKTIRAIIGGALGGLGGVVVIVGLVTHLLRARYRKAVHRQSLDLLDEEISQQNTDEESIYQQADQVPSPFYIANSQGMPSEERTKGTQAPSVNHLRPNPSITDLLEMAASPSSQIAEHNSPSAGRPTRTVVAWSKLTLAIRRRTTALPTSRVIQAADVDTEKSSRPPRPRLSIPVAARPLGDPTFMAQDTDRRSILQYQTIEALIARDVPVHTLTAINVILSEGGGSSRALTYHEEPATPAPPAYQER